MEGLTARFELDLDRNIFCQEHTAIQIRDRSNLSTCPAPPRGSIPTRRAHLAHPSILLKSQQYQNIMRYIRMYVQP